MKRFAALLAVTTFSVMGCDHRTPTAPDPAGLRLTPGSSQAKGSAGGTLKVRISGSAQIHGRELAVSVSILNGVPGEECAGGGTAVARDGSNVGSGGGLWRNDGNTTHLVFMFETAIAQTWTDGRVDVEFTAECPSGTAADQQTVQAHR